LSGSPPKLWAAKAVTLAATAQQACHRANSDGDTRDAEAGDAEAGDAEAGAAEATDGTAVAERAAFVVDGVCLGCGGWTYKRSGRCCLFQA
jgi:hypothetical protein